MARGGGRQAAADVFLGQQVQVCVHFAIEIPILAVACEEAADARDHESEPSGHDRQRCASRSIRIITAEIRSQFCACAASCFRPLLVMA